MLTCLRPGKALTFFIFSWNTSGSGGETAVALCLRSSPGLLLLSFLRGPKGGRDTWGGLGEGGGIIRGLAGRGSLGRQMEGEHLTGKGEGSGHLKSRVLESQCITVGGAGVSVTVGGAGVSVLQWEGLESVCYSGRSWSQWEGRAVGSSQWRRHRYQFHQFPSTASSRHSSRNFSRTNVSVFQVRIPAFPSLQVSWPTGVGSSKVILLS